MRFNNGELELVAFDLDHIQDNIDIEKMTLQEAFEEDLSMFKIDIKEVYSVEAKSNLWRNKEYCDLLAKIVCEVNFGRKAIK